MSLDLTIATSPAVRAKVHDMPVGRFTELWDVDNPCNRFTIGDDDFAQLIYYWLTNVDLTGDDPEDPRRSLLQRVRQLKEVPGFNIGNKRLE